MSRVTFRTASGPPSLFFVKALAVLGGLLALGSLGGVYAWSALGSELERMHGYSARHMQLVFGAAIASFALSMVPAGRLLARGTSPARLGAVSAVLFGGGFVLGGLYQESLTMLVLSMGVVLGVGIGFGYVSALATVLGCLPNRKGLAVGLAVSTFAAASMVLAAAIDWMLGLGVAMSRIFSMLGLTYFCVILLGAFLQTKAPRSEVRTNAHAVQPFRADASFWRLFAAMFSGTFAGLLVIGSMKPLALEAGVTAELATSFIGAFALGNAGGRLAWGAVHDRMGPRTVSVALGLLSVSLALLVAAPGNPWLFAVAVVLVGFCFGACFVLFAACLAELHGPGAIASIYPWLFLSYGAAGLLGPWLGGLLRDVTGSYTPAVWLAASVALLGVPFARSVVQSTSASVGARVRA
jgi:OFA family oxalate/formate antiporter-like MFS transporter